MPLVHRCCHDHVNVAVAECKLLHLQWRRQGVGVGGQNIGGLGDGSPPVGSRGEAPIVGLGDEVPQKLKRFCKVN